MSLRDLLTLEVLEGYVADMIISDMVDMEEVKMESINIRKVSPKHFKIYRPIDNEEVFFHTRYDHDTDHIKTNSLKLLIFTQDYITAMRAMDIIDRQFTLHTITEIILFSFTHHKDSIINYVPAVDIDDYIKLGIDDGLEDIIMRSQHEPEIRELYSDYVFSYTAWEIIIEEEDLEGLATPDIEWLEQNGLGVGDNINGDDLYVNVEERETQRFKTYLENREELIIFEKVSIQFYLEVIVYPYQADYDNLIHWIMNESIEDSEDEEMVVMTID